MPNVKHLAVIMLICSLAFCNPVPAQEFSESLQKPVRQSIATRKESQQAREQWQTEKEKRIAAYEALETRRNELLAARADLQKRLSAQQTRNLALTDQLAKLEEISRDIVPFLEDTRQRLAALLQREPALLPQERSQRLTRLETLLQDPAVDMGEKYRKTMEALFIEAEYGHTVDVYQQTISVEKLPLTVKVVRLGHLALFYQSMDRKTCGYFDRAAGTWRPLPAVHNKSLRTAIEITGKQRPAQMVPLPIGRMVTR